MITIEPAEERGLDATAAAAAADDDDADYRVPATAGPGTPPIATHPERTSP